MSEMNILWLGALALVLVSLVFLLPSLVQESAAPATTSDDALRTLYRQQLEDLAREHRAGNLNTSDLEQAKEELHHRLLIELDQRSQPGLWHRKPWLPRVSGLLLAVTLPMAAFALYVQVGDPQAAARLAASNDMSHGAGDVQVESMVQGLANRLAHEPDNLPGFIMLARSYETMERYADAAATYAQAIEAAQNLGLLAEDEAHLWADMADALGSAQNGQLDGPATDAITQALKLHPQQGKALALAGSAALQKAQYEEARQHWRILLSLLEPGSDIALKVQDDLFGLEVFLNQ